MDYAKQFVYGSMPLRLTVGQWLLTAVLLLVALLALPRLAASADAVRPSADDRIPYDFSNDYWLAERWFAAAARDHDVLLLGDSVVWGEYVAPGETLSAELNRQCGSAAFANLGMNGLHPAALYGLLRYHGAAVRDRDVILVLNSLWMSSPRQDLRYVPSADEDLSERPLNHPAMLPQFWPRIASFGAPFESRAGVVLERSLPGLAWISHLRTKGAWYAARADGDPAAAEAAVSGPRIDLPQAHPFAALRRPVPLAENAPHSAPQPWTERGLAATTIPWPAAAESVQWRFFRQAVELLRQRGNRVLVWVSPFNPYLQTPAGRAAHAAMVHDMVAWLEANQVPVTCGTAPPSEEYADASHPLAPGYARLARELQGNDVFREWRSRSR